LAKHALFSTKPDETESKFRFINKISLNKRTTINQSAT
jgi:hypothetical protein